MLVDKYDELLELLKQMTTDSTIKDKLEKLKIKKPKG